MKKAFTLVELIVAVTISAIILILLVEFLNDTFIEISYSNKKTKILNNIYEIENIINNKKNSYLSGYILIDNVKGNGSDVLLFSSTSGESKQGGYIFASVLVNDMKIDKNNNVGIIGNKLLGYRKISSQELVELQSDPTKVYDYKFNSDEIFKDINIKDFQVNIYNSGSIYELELYVNLDYNPHLNGTKYSDNGNTRIEKIIFDL